MEGFIVCLVSPMTNFTIPVFISIVIRFYFKNRIIIFWVPNLLYYCIYQNGLDLNHCSAYPKKFYVDAFLYLLLPLNFSLLLPFANSVRSIPSKFWSGLIRYISKISYSMYLIHYSLLFIPFFSFISVQNDYQVWALYILYWTLLLGASSLLYRYFELPIMNLRDRMK